MKITAFRTLCLIGLGGFATLVGCGASADPDDALLDAAPASETASVGEALNLDAADGSAWIAPHGLTSSAFQTEFDKRVAQGYRLTDLDGYDQDGGTRFAALFQKVSGPSWSARSGLTSSALQNEVNEREAAGYYPVMADGYTVDGQVRYSVIFHKNTSGVVWRIRHGLSSSSYQTEFEQAVSEGYRPFQQQLTFHGHLDQNKRSHLARPP